MFEEVAGLPAHPLVVHAPIALVPLLIAVAVGYAVIPPWRRLFGWALVLLAVLAPGAVYLARQSGLAFEDRLAGNDALPEQLADKVNAHEALSQTLLWFTLGLSGASLLLALVGRAARRSAEPETPGYGYEYESEQPRSRVGLTILSILLVIAVLGLSGATGWYLFRTGDTGARMVWEGS